MQHHIINDRIYRIIKVEAAETKEAAAHISAQRPIGFTQAAEVRKAAA